MGRRGKILLCCLLSLTLAGCGYLPSERTIAKRLSLIQSATETGVIIPYFTNPFYYELNGEELATRITWEQLATHENIFAYECSPPKITWRIGYTYTYQTFGNGDRWHGTYETWWWRKGTNPLLYKIRINTLP